MSALLAVHDAHVAYGKVEVVRSVSLDIAEGEIVTIIGANGAGKTTLLNAIMGILPLRGRIAFAGQDLSRLEIEDRVGLGLSLVPEHRELFWSMCVEDNLQLGAFKVSKTQARDAFERSHPCPATGRTSGPCRGHVVDHIQPLACGGADAPGNMQWQTKAEGKSKDKWERTGCQVK